MAPSGKGKSQPFNPNNGRRFKTLYCPTCPARDGTPVALVPVAIMSRGPVESGWPEAERIKTPNYDYKCPYCGEAPFNLPYRPLEKEGEGDST
jgi:hypothetical protein